MTEKLYYWAENLDGYSSDNEQNYDQVIEIKRLNFFIGKNNAGKSRFLRNLFKTVTPFEQLNYPTNTDQILQIKNLINTFDDYRFSIDNRLGYNKNHILPHLEKILNAPLFPRSNYRSIFEQNYTALSQFTYHDNLLLPELYEKNKEKYKIFSK